MQLTEMPTVIIERTESTIESKTGRRISLVLVIILILVLVFGIFVARVIAASIYNQAVANETDTQVQSLDAYREKVSGETDVTHLVATGNKLLDKKMYAYAAINFGQASNLDPNLRDADYAWAYTLLEANKTNLSADDLKDAQTALSRAEHVDPLSPEVIQLKKALAELQGDKASEAAADARLKDIQTHS